MNEHRVRDCYVRAEVECKKCGRRFVVDSYPYRPHPITIKTEGATLLPYLREIVEAEAGPVPELVPCVPPTRVDSCSVCERPTIHEEGATFKKRGSRGQLSKLYYKCLQDANEHSQIREWLYEPKQLRDAQTVLGGLSVREIEEQFGISKSTASRAKKKIASLLVEQKSPMAAD
jgi:transposase-like protein